MVHSHVFHPCETVKQLLSGQSRESERENIGCHTSFVPLEKLFLSEKVHLNGLNFRRLPLVSGGVVKKEGISKLSSDFSWRVYCPVLKRNAFADFSFSLSLP